MSLYFRIAELAELYGLNCDTLRYYEEQGLLHPRRGENRYREYSVSDLCDLNIIRFLREMGVGIEGIKKYLNGRTVAKTDNMLSDQEQVLKARIELLQEELHNAGMRRERLNAAVSRPTGKVELVEFPERPCVFLRENGIPEPNIDYLLTKLERNRQNFLKELGNRWMGAMIDPLAVREKRYDLYNAVFFLCEKVQEADEVLPAGKYLSYIHEGSYEDIQESHRALYAYAEKEGMKPTDTLLEVYLIDVHDTSIVEEYRTELQLKVGD